MTSARGLVVGVVEEATQVLVRILDPCSGLGPEGSVGTYEVGLTGVAEAEQPPILSCGHGSRECACRDLGDDGAEDVRTGSNRSGHEQHRLAARRDVERHVGQDRIADGDGAELLERTTDPADVPELIADRGPRQSVGTELDPFRDRVHDVEVVGVDEQEIGRAGVPHQLTQNRVVLGVGCAVTRTVAGVVELATLVEAVRILGDVVVLDVPARSGTGHEIRGVDVGTGFDERWEELVVVDGR